jgi:hypothetical protein
MVTAAVRNVGDVALRIIDPDLPRSDWTITWAKPL